MPSPDSELGQWFATHAQPHVPVSRAWLHSRFRTEDAIYGPAQESSLVLLRARERGERTVPQALRFAGVRPLALDRFRHREACERHRRRWGDCNALVQWPLAHGTAPNPNPNPDPNPDPLVRYLRT